jgi:ABC-type transporter Mla MlaB component
MVKLAEVKDGNNQLNFCANLTIQEVGEVSQSIKTIFDNGMPLTVDITDIQHIDTAGAQLLCAVFKESKNKNVAMREGDDSIQSLTDSFTSIVESVYEMDSKINKLNKISGHKDIIDKISGESQEISSRVQQSIVAFQFYDKLSQRLSHVSHALGA